MSRFIEELSKKVNQNLIQERDNAFNELVQNEHEFGNYLLKFLPSINQQSTTGTAIFFHKNGTTATGTFEVYISDNAIYATLFSNNNIKLLDRPFTEYLNIIKLMLLSK